MKKTLFCTLLALGVQLATAQQRPAITGLAFVRFYAGDAAASADFYGKTLGYSPVQANGVTLYPVNDLQWIETAPLPNPAPPTRQAAVGFMTRDARALEKYLKAHSVSIVDPLKNGVFSVRDPEGNLIFFVDQKSGVARTVAKAKIPAGAVSRRIIHTGFVVRDADAESRFYRELLDFRAYWRGGRDDTTIDYISQQVPEGSDWLEYMLNVSPTATLKQLGGSDHVSLGVAQMATAVAALEHNGCQGPTCTATRTGRDGKTQLNLFDPDLSRIELMEFKPSGTTCCSPYTAAHPAETESR